MTGEQATFLARHFADLMESEFPTTVKVLRAVPDDRRDYKPDPKSRTAWDLASHIAQSDVWFLDSIVNGAFTFDAAATRSLIDGFGDIGGLVAYYEQAMPAAIARVRAMGPDEATREVDFFGLFQRPAAALLGLASNHGVHHRGQLAAYLRAMGSTVPALYGDSADQPFGK